MRAQLLVGRPRFLQLSLNENERLPVGLGGASENGRRGAQVTAPKSRLLHSAQRVYAFPNAGNWLKEVRVRCLSLAGALSSFGPSKGGDLSLLIDTFELALFFSLILRLAAAAVSFRFDGGRKVRATGPDRTTTTNNDEQPVFTHTHTHAHSSSPSAI